MSSPQRASHTLRWWLVGYAALIGVVVLTMIRTRHSTIAQLSSPQSISDWRTWRNDESTQQVKKGLVERRVPKSDEPPALVLMRDYFAILMVGALLFSSLLYWIIAWFVSGILGPHVKV